MRHWREVCSLLRSVSIFLLAMLTIIVFRWSGVSKAEVSNDLELRIIENHHIVKLGSDQPYVAGYHVNTKDLSTRENVDSTAVTVSFPSTNAGFFPLGSWLAGGMFVQAQDSRYRHVDYGFYMMVVLDSFGSVFIDLGLHQTREGTLPVQMPAEEIVYAYTWQVSGIDLRTPVTLLAGWDAEGWVHYSFSASERNVSLTSVDVASLPNCENIIRKFYAGNVIVEPFPFSRYVNYFQFGVVSSEPIADSHWNVALTEPRMLRDSGWVFVDKAWSIQGDIAYLDWDWMWGGTPYIGVSAKYYQHPLSSPYEVIFSYSGFTLATGTVLWEYSSADFDTADSASPHADKTWMMASASCLMTAFLIIICVIVASRRLRGLERDR